MAIIEIKQMLIQRTDNRPNKPFAGGKAAYITVHMTGNTSAGADAYAHAVWAYQSAPYSWHLTVDDTEAWQHLREDEQGWHAGDGLDGPGNTTSIAVEICMNSDIDQEKAYDNAAWLVAELLRRGHGARGIVQHYHWTGKNCPQLIRAVPGRWERFLEQVEAYYMDPVVQKLIDIFGGEEGITGLHLWYMAPGNPKLPEVLKGLNTRLTNHEGLAHVKPTHTHPAVAHEHPHEHDYSKIGHTHTKVTYE